MVNVFGSQVVWGASSFLEELNQLNRLSPNIVSRTCSGVSMYARCCELGRRGTITAKGKETGFNLKGTMRKL